LYVPTVLNIAPSPLSLCALVGAIFPVSNTPGSVALWATVSEFNQFTVWPTFTVNGFGEYKPFLIVTVSRFGGFVPSGLVGEIGEVGEVVLEFVELPHAIADSASRMITPTVDRVSDSLNAMFQQFATPVPSNEAEPSPSERLSPAQRSWRCSTQ
jgi:hypothetical protein